ncbi:epoxide hydrolase family protein [Dysgonomonas gadei]|uniref:Epoxide hydrolase N-terminal domain-containing protein n=1 Tax=Dysgonomonas gadei ATCC BAA-286 TaxID=742766 RepID=F5J287_9BACT|nr:epoxide hydrolase family protein [Dysgonomonas gadei]EGK00207.1 hypothetical protein HMPREF9455_03346 [Dysgonomonas gadei ATCC BAA-286]
MSIEVNKETFLPFRINVSQAEIDDLKQRLSTIRWPEKETVSDWQQGVPLAKAQELADYWRNKYDWKRFEKQANTYSQFITNIDGIDIHFFHVKSKYENALPLILLHGWPGSIVEFIKLIEPLTNPVAHGGKAEDAFHVIIPSIPGWGFSELPKEVGWDMSKSAQAFIILMQRLGYSRWAVQGGDLGGAIATSMGQIAPDGLIGIHLNILYIMPNPFPENLTEEERAAIDAFVWTQGEDGGYSHMQRTRPQTLAYGLIDSPIAQATWIYEKFYRWTDHSGDPTEAISLDQILDNISLHWFTKSMSARTFWENRNFRFDGAELKLPVAATIFKNDIFKYPRNWAEQSYPNLIFWNEVDNGAHFGSLEQPQQLVDDIRRSFALIR